MMNKRFLFVSGCVATVLFSSCKKDKNDDPVAVTQTGKYFISEGGFAANNSKLGYYDDGSGGLATDFFAQQNPGVSGGLGDLANDAIIYGTKLYIVMNGSGRVTVLNAADGKQIGTVSFLNGTTNRNPRYLIGHNGRVFVSAWDSKVSVIDTAALTIVSNFITGPNPEGLAAEGNLLYVANSGSFNPTPDSTVSVIDLTNGAEVRKIKVGVNPYKVERASNGNIYVSAYGNFGSVPASVWRIDNAASTSGVNLGSAFQYSNVRVFNNVAFFFNNYGSSGVKVYNTDTRATIRENFIADGTTFQNVYGVDVDPANGDVYITDSKDFTAPGTVSVFTAGGVRKALHNLAPGVNPNKTVFKQ